ncbi:helix-turn-helix domain-containing protein [Umezawaea endophytica]|uniref:Helix-turn-helix domain-containing protein n=1 Tax=Umezawaea endophytica TaxID=1654476 RepID=A0A9X3ALG9_9PSEU|nr:helix-turn-helix transcriptional regulator [Umezawaea endophytica]MCS7484410.1 helix-turn-helix domain-containing protein [Umezawaea endophytica]
MSSERPRRSAHRADYHRVLGVHLRALREAQGITGLEMAERFGMSTAWVSKIENGQRGPSPASLGHYCDALEIGVVDLLAQVGITYRLHRNPFSTQEPSQTTLWLDGLALYAGFPSLRMLDDPSDLALPGEVDGIPEQSLVVPNIEVLRVREQAAEILAAAGLAALELAAESRAERWRRAGTGEGSDASKVRANTRYVEWSRIAASCWC